MLKGSIVKSQPEQEFYEITNFSCSRSINAAEKKSPFTFDEYFLHKGVKQWKVASQKIGRLPWVFFLNFLVMELNIAFFNNSNL